MAEKPLLSVDAIDGLARHSMQREVARFAKVPDHATYIRAGVKAAGGIPVAHGPAPYNGMTFDRRLISAAHAKERVKTHEPVAQRSTASAPAERVATAGGGELERSLTGSLGQRKPPLIGPKANQTHNRRALDLTQRPATRDRWKAPDMAHVESRVFQDVERPAKDPTRFDKMSVRDLLGRSESRQDADEDSGPQGQGDAQASRVGTAARRGTAASSRASTAVSMRSSMGSRSATPLLVPATAKKKTYNKGDTMRVTGTPSHGTSVFIPKDMDTPRALPADTSVDESWKTRVPNLGVERGDRMLLKAGKVPRYVGASVGKAPYLVSHSSIATAGCCFTDTKPRKGD